MARDIKTGVKLTRGNGNTNVEGKGKPTIAKSNSEYIVILL